MFRLTYLLCEMVPLEFGQVFETPEIIVIGRAFLPSHWMSIQHFCNLQYITPACRSEGQHQEVVPKALLRSMLVATRLCLWSNYHGIIWQVSAIAGMHISSVCLCPSPCWDSMNLICYTYCSFLPLIKQERGARDVPFLRLTCPKILSTLLRTFCRCFLAVFSCVSSD